MNVLWIKGIKLALLIIGKPMPLEEEYINAHKELDVRVEMDIPQKKLFDYLSKANGLIYPSLYEGFGLPIVEALQVGTPVIACQGRGMEEAIGQYGITLLDPLDEHELASKIELLYDRSQIKIAQDVNKHLEQFSAETVIAQHMDMYKNLQTS